MSIRLTSIMIAVVAVLAAPMAVYAQDPTPTPAPTITPVPPTTGTTWEPSQTYYDLESWIDSVFVEIDSVMDDVELALDDLDEALADVQSLVQTGTINVDGDTWTLDEIADEIATALGWAFLWRCYIDSPLTSWLLIFIAWIILVLLIKMAMSLLPYVIQIATFLWGILRDVWEAIPFIN